MDEKDTQQAIDAFKLRLNNNPDDLEAALNLGNLFFDNRDAAQSIVYYNVALRINPDMPGAMTDLGTMYWQNGDVSLAERCFRSVVKSNPGYGNAYINLGLLLSRAKMEPVKGKACWQELVDKYPDHPACKRAKELLADTLN
ncbi:MAG: tetratricopeptide repeat protein [Gammaproteobacteria bacterium]|nr:tetratricopeptide repeat protein [Gammaproteobacteria bacterium]MDH5802043.1 tetratricopeptide repeat protein [Gammaproteobacteria bacterium]